MRVCAIVQNTLCGTWHVPTEEDYQVASLVLEHTWLQNPTGSRTSLQPGRPPPLVGTSKLAALNKPPYMPPWLPQAALVSEGDGSYCKNHNLSIDTTTIHP